MQRRQSAGVILGGRSTSSLERSHHARQLRQNLMNPVQVVLFNPKILRSADLDVCHDALGSGVCLQGGGDIGISNYSIELM